MSGRRASQDARRAREFEAYVAGAAGRLLHAATLLTAEVPGRAPRATALLTGALAATMAAWDRLRGEDPYDHTRRQLTQRYTRGAWRDLLPAPRGADGAGRGVLFRLGPRQRLILVLRLYEGVAEEQTAALVGLAPERVRALYERALTTVLDPPAAAPGLAKVVPS
ncbi:sigma factor-like helix-turn-helix DNA-binding protein [Streptomyces sp. NPDC050560]|uniref:sigma factor-like helix-turn-helix DNA-binding protein n=1 Tax=Streptomyces sp. NPDC050560 TaxID=3365630 RepID=UPI0037B3FEC8